MAKISIKAGTTSKTIDIFLQDSSSSVGAGLTGLLYNSAGLTCYYYREGAASATSVTLATMTVGTWATGGFKEIDGTNMPGMYQFGIPNAAIASGAASVKFFFKGATNLTQQPIELELTATDNQDAVRGGMTAMPNANAGASGGLLINGSNSGTVTLAALTITGATTHTGALICSAGIAITQSAGNTAGVSIAGNGSAAGLSITGGATGAGVTVIGGGTSGAGITVTTTSGDGLSLTPTAGHGLVVTGNGASKHGAIITGGTSGTSDGLKAVAGSGGVPIRGDITGNITGTLSGGVTVTTNNDKTGYSLSQSFPSNFASMSITAGGAISINAQVKKNTAISQFPLKMVLSSDHISPATGKTVSVTRSIDGAAFAATATATATEISNGWYYIPLAAADVNGNSIIIRATATACDASEVTISTQP